MSKKSSNKKTKLKKTTKSAAKRRTKGPNRRPTKKTTRRATRRETKSVNKKTKLKTILKKAQNNTEKKYLKKLTFKDLNEISDFENKYIDKCVKSANDRINIKNKTHHSINQNNIKKYCSCTYNSLISNKKSINEIENNFFNSLKPCIKKFNNSTKRFSSNKSKKKKLIIHKK